MPQQKQDIFLALFIVFLWGLHAPIMKMMVTEVPPFLGLTMRFALTALVFLPFAKIEREHLAALVKVGLIVYGINFACGFLAIRYLESSTYVLIGQVQAPFSALAGYFFFKERIDIKVWIGLAVVFTGLFIMFGEPKVRDNIFGALLVVMASLAWVIGSVFMKQLKNTHAPTFNAVTVLVALPCHALLSFLFERQEYGRLAFVHWGEMSLILAYQVFAMSFALMTWQRLLSRNDLYKMNSLNLLTPVIGVLCSMVLLDEKLTPLLLAGGMLVLLGVIIMNNIKYFSRLKFS